MTGECIDTVVKMPLGFLTTNSDVVFLKFRAFAVANV